VIVEGRTQFHFLPESIKIYLRVNLSEGARRIWEQIKDNKEKEERNENEVNSLEEMEENLKKRMENDTERYMKYYGFDCYDEKHYDLIIDTTSITVEGVAEKIVEFAERFK